MTADNQRDSRTAFLAPHSAGFVFAGGEGRWHTDRSLITNYPEQMDLGKDEVDARDIFAVPDVWARPLLFFDALTDVRHPAHRAVVGEWRGLLATVCLADTYFPRSIAVRTHDLVHEGAQPDPAPIAQVCEHSKPADSWSWISLIYLDDIMVGATSPWSLVFTPPDYQLPSKVFWRNDAQMYRDPAKLLDDPETRSRLAAWIGDLSKTVQNLEIPEDRLESLDREVNAFQRDVSQTLLSTSTGKLAIPIAPSLNLSSIAHQEGTESDFLLDEAYFRKGCLEKDVLFLDRDGWSSGSWLAPGISSSKYQFPSGPRGHEVVPGVLERNWIDPVASFFVDRIVRTRKRRSTSEETRLGVLNSNGRRYLLPVRTDIFSYLDAKTVANNLTIEEVAGGRVRVELSLPSSSGRTLRFRKEYGVSEQIVDFTERTVLLWPNVRLPGWNHYYLYYVNGGNWECQPYSWQMRGNTPNPKEVKDDEFSCTYYRADDSLEAVTFSSNGEYLGLIIPDLEEPVQAGVSDAWALAIDFGASNTSVAFRSLDNPDEEPKPLQCDPRVATLMFDEDSDTTNLDATRNFYPLYSTKTFPVGTVLDAFGHEQTDPSFLFKHGMVPWIPRLFYEGGYQHLKAGLKWGTGTERLDNARLYIEHILVRSVLEARVQGITQVHIGWTYPSAFDDTRREYFNGIWIGRIQAIREECGLETSYLREAATIPENADVGSAHIMTESTAVALYFRRFHGAALGAEHVPAVCIDIGGGTTDIAVWLGQSIAVQSSILFAGNSITDCVRAYEGKLARELLTMVGLDETLPDYELLLAMLSSKEYDTLAAVINDFLNYQARHRSVSENIAGGGKAWPGIKRLLSVMFVTYGAMVHYSGLLVRSLIDNGRRIDGADYYFGGNGSRALDWFGGLVQLRERLKDFLGGPESASPRFFDSRRLVEQKEDFKLEVALGALCPTIPATSVGLAVVLSGESGLSFEDSPVSATFDLCSSTSDGGRGLSFSPDSELPELTRFLTVASNHAKQMNLEPVSLIGDREDFQAHHVIQKIHDSLSVAVESRNAPNEPMFIIGVKEAIRNLIERPLGAEFTQKK